MRPPAVPVAKPKSRHGWAAAVSLHPASLLQSKERIRLSSFALLLTFAAALLLLVPVGSANAAPPAGQDQYLEPVPDAGGRSGPRARQDFSRSLGGSDGKVTEADVRRQAEKNRSKRKKRRAGATEATGPTGEAAPEPPAPAESVKKAAKIGPFSRSGAIAILAIIAAAALLALFMRNRGSGTQSPPPAPRPPIAPPPPPGAN